MDKLVIGDDFEMVGYVQFYLYLEFTDGTSTISSISFDFSKDINRKILKDVVEFNANYYKEKMNKTQKGFKFVTKETYDEFYKNFETEETLSWDENGVYVDGQKIKEDE